MADQKTTQFPDAATLTGDEIVGVVQDGGDVKTTISAIGTYTFGGKLTPNVVLGGESYAYALSSGQVAIGLRVSTSGTGSVAIGYKAYSDSAYAISMGYGITTYAPNSIGIGFHNDGQHAAGSISIGTFGKADLYGIAIGYSAAASAYSVAIGWESMAILDQDHAVAIGSHAKAYSGFSIAIGHHSKTASENFGIAIGYYAETYGIHSIAIGTAAYVLGASDDGIAIGNLAHVSGLKTIAIGSSALSNTESGTALGSGSVAAARNAVALGYGAYSGGTSGLSVGTYAHVNSGATLAVALGYDSQAASPRSVAIGPETSAGSGRSIAIGSETVTGTEGYGSIALGTSAYANQTSISVGYNATCSTVAKGIAIGSGTRTQSDLAITIGYDSYVNGSPSAISIGAYATSKSSNHGIAIGMNSYSHGGNSIGIGYHAIGFTANSIAMGTNAQATGNGGIAFVGKATNSYSITMGGVSYGDFAMAFGNGSAAVNSYSVVIGKAVDNTMASFVTAGYPNTFDSVAFTPTESRIKMTAITSATIAASFTFTVGSTTATITYKTTGTSGNSAVFEITDQSPTINGTPFVNAGPSALQLGLPTDGSGTTIGLELNTIDLSATNFTITFGDGTQEITEALSSTALSGGVDGTGPLVMTVNGNGVPEPITTMTLAPNTMGSLSGTVFGYEPGIFTGSADAATFSLDPLLCYADADGNYHFIGTPTFDSINATVGAADWVVPALSVVGNDETPMFQILVDDQGVASIGWMAFLELNANQ